MEACHVIKYIRESEDIRSEGILKLDYYTIGYIIRLRPLLFCRTIDRTDFIINNPIYTSHSIMKKNIELMKEK